VDGTHVQHDAVIAHAFFFIAGSNLG
jgi:hypothetical protein